MVTLFIFCFLFLHPFASEAITVIDAAGTSWSAQVANLTATNYQFVQSDFKVDFAPQQANFALDDVVNGVLAVAVTDSAYPAEWLASHNTYQLPIISQAVVIAFNLESFNPSINQSLVLNMPLLAAIWSGEVVYWDDDAITQLNQGLNLPHAPIMLVFADDTGGSISDVFSEALAPHNSVFAGLAAPYANNTFSGKMSSYSSNVNRSFVTPALVDQLYTVLEVQNSMTYATPAMASLFSLPFAKMVNAAKNTVSPTVDSVQSALMDVIQNSQPLYVAVIASNGNGSNSWPIVMMSSVSTQTNVHVVSCYYQTFTQKIFSWGQLNEYFNQVVTSNGYVPMPLAYKRILMVSFSKIYCNGLQTFTEKVAIGEGVDFQIGIVLNSQYAVDPNFELYHYIVNSSQALEDIYTNSIDYALVGEIASVNHSAVSLSRRELIPASSDEFNLPLYAFAVVAAYNVPTLLGQEALVLNLSVLADIFLGNITSWNDTAIRELNPALMDLLPDQSINVIFGTSRPTITNILTMALSQASAAFQSAVDMSNGSFPQEYLPNGTVIVANPMDALDANFSFGVWTQEQITPLLYVGAADLINPQGIRVTANNASILSTLQDFENEPLDTPMVNGRGNGSWPMVAYNYFVTRTASFINCDVARSLVDFVYWVQTSAEALATISENSLAVPIHPVAKKKLVELVSSMECGGQPVSPYAPCVNNFTVCSNQGSCNYSGKCLCDQGFTGAFCQLLVPPASSSNEATIIGAVVGSVVPTILILLAAFTIGVIIFWLLRTNKEYEWEVDLSELEMAEQIGMGAFGTVRKAMWKGTEVAVKTLIVSDSPQRAVNREIQRSFKEEVRVMTALRHPNVVLFMGACTKQPTMCIIMEYMALGSLYELLHNELVPEVPFKLKLKIANQAAKGMHFLHSSGIVHRDLKSLNLLLDSKWNIKVSDFGLTRSKEYMEQERHIEGSIHWMAPEVLSELPGLDYMMADVYSFGVILWELLTREAPYAGMTPAAIAVAVIRDGKRPSLGFNENDTGGTILGDAMGQYKELMCELWDQEPKNRPTFLEAMTRLNVIMHDDLYSSTTTSQITTSGSISQSQDFEDLSHLSLQGIDAPEGEVTIVFSAISQAAILWEFNPNAMRDATILHNALLRSVLKTYSGYEVALLSGQGSFCMAFSDADKALQWCTDVQRQLIQVEWPRELLENPATAEEWDEIKKRIIFKGLRVRMGIHVGNVQMVRDDRTKQVKYIGPVVDTASCITSMANGGQIVLSESVIKRLERSGKLHSDLIVKLGHYQLPGTPDGGISLFEAKCAGLEAREFTELELADPEKELNETSHKEKHLITSANLCRWMLDYDELTLNKQIGLGSFGVVFRGQWNNIDVAVKRLMKQKVDEKTMLNFLAEVGFLAELQHPNIVLLIGACVKIPNLCIVTEFAKRGSLRDILLDNCIRLPWEQRVKLLQSAASGIAYLHNHNPVIVHRDLKPSNLLVDENWNVKVADFGLACIKEDNVTMTRCGTPCWTAPEVVRGERYSEKVDVYSFGIIIWEVITRKQPFAGANFMRVTLEVLEGARPPVPKDCPEPVAKLMKKCWHPRPEKRPAIEKALSVLEGFLDAPDSLFAA